MSITKSELMKLQNGSDVRGIACEGIEGEHVTLTSEAAYLIGRAFAIWLLKKKNIAPEECIVGVGTDSRITGPEIKNFVAGRPAYSVWYLPPLYPPRIFSTPAE